MTRIVKSPHKKACSLGLAMLCLLIGSNFAWCQQNGSSATASGSGASTGSAATQDAAAAKPVSIFAVVRDKHGDIVGNLTKDDFTLEEDGHPQTIQSVTAQSDLPLTFGVLVDTSVSQREYFDQEHAASYTFLDQNLRQDKDVAFVLHFDYQVELLQDITASRGKLERALGELQTGQPKLQRSGDPDDSGGQDSQQQGGSWPGGGSSGRRRGGSGSSSGDQLYDAIFLASGELLANQHGRKVMIILSDGVDRGSKTYLERAIETAQRSDTIIYTVLLPGEHQSSSPFSTGGGWGGLGGGGMGRHGGGRQQTPQEQHPDGKKTLERIANETGGRFFEYSKKQTLGQIYDQIRDDLHNQYSIVYTPNHVDGNYYSKIHLTVKKGTVQAREGYYPVLP